MPGKTPKNAIAPKEFIKLFLETAVKSVVFTCLWIPVYLFRFVLILFVQKTKPSYGKIQNYLEATVEEDYKDLPTKTTIAFTMVLDGLMEAKELKSVFTRTVLEAKVQDKKTGEDELRFKEYKQYQVDLLGYRFWRDDEKFNVDNHILEERYSEKHSSLQEVHEEAMNKPYKLSKSPWEIVVVPRYQNEERTLLIYRSHHSLGDTKSLLKVLVEGLGEKQLILPEARYAKEELLEKIRYYLLLPFFFVYVQVLDHFAGLRGDDCPYKFNGEEEPLVNVGISEKISVSDIKKIAKNHGVNTSALVMAGFAGGIAKSDARLSRKDISCKWVLPKPGHPVKLHGDYCYTATIDLPTTQSLPKECLENCDIIFQNLKQSDIPAYDKSIQFQTGTWCSPLRQKYMKNNAFPLILTNIAGDKEGFQIGGRNVLEHTMTCGPLLGASG